MKKETKSIILFIIMMTILLAITALTTFLTIYGIVNNEIFIFIDNLLFSIFMYTNIIGVLIVIFNSNPKIGITLFRFIIPIMAIIFLCIITVLNIIEGIWAGVAVDIVCIGFTGYCLWKRVKHRNG